MCGRYDFHGSVADLTELFSAIAAPAPTGAAVTARYNVCPTAWTWTVRARGEGTAVAASRTRTPGRAAVAATAAAPPHEVVPMRFGLRRHDGGLLLNARGETAASLRTFRGALAARRCLVPVHGFYEWAAGTRPRQPSYFYPEDGGIVALAALWFPPPASATDQGAMAVIVTGAADATVAPVHGRMPLVLPVAAGLDWLASPAAAAALLAAPPPAGLLARKISTRINRAGVDDAALLDPV